jgi:peptidyl-prolyl cis-trans isomerase B (cyclophilin B)
MRTTVVALALATTLTLSACGADASPSASTNANGCPSSQPATLNTEASHDIAFETSLGTFVVRLAVKNSPIAVSNLTALASCNFYNNVIFHRIAYMEDGTPFVIQGGDPTGTGSGGPGYFIKDEPVVGTYRRGVIAMARSSQPDSQGSQFFVILEIKSKDKVELYEAQISKANCDVFKLKSKDNILIKSALIEL